MLSSIYKDNVFDSFCVSIVAKFVICTKFNTIMMKKYKRITCRKPIFVHMVWL